MSRIKNDFSDSEYVSAREESGGKIEKPKYYFKISRLKHAFSALKHISARKHGDGRVKPRLIVFEVTDKCNSRCKHCNIWNTKNKDRCLTTEEIVKTFSDPLFSEVEFFNITGGEPVLRQDIKEILQEIHNRIPKATFAFSTNALLPDKVLDICRFSIENDINLLVGISMDGIGKHHDDMRGVPGNFEKADYLLKKLKKLKKETGKIDYTIGFTLSELTKNFADEMIAHAKKYDIDLIAQMYEEGSFYTNLNNVDQKIEDLILSIKKFPDSIYHRFVIKSLKYKYKFKCYAMNTFFLLRYNGDVTPCLKLSNLSAGNVKNDAPSKIWKSENAKQIRNKIKCCEGCLNTWGVSWSINSSVYPLIPLILKNPKFLLKRK